MNPSQKARASTQKFTEIVDIVDTVVIMQGGNACMIIEVTASNFALLSKDEQDARLYAYASLLNSLTFPIQILIRNKRVDVSSYIKQLEVEEKRTPNPLLAKHINLYKNFVREMVKVNIVLNKMFYVVIPYTSLEAGVGGAVHAVGAQAAGQDNFVSLARKMLQSKADSIGGQLKKLAISARILEKEELVKLYYDIYNDAPIDPTQIQTDARSAVIKPSDKA